MPINAAPIAGGQVVAGSNPVSPTKVSAGQGHIDGQRTSPVRYLHGVCTATRRSCLQIEGGCYLRTQARPSGREQEIGWSVEAVSVPTTGSEPLSLYAVVSTGTATVSVIYPS